MRTIGMISLTALILTGLPPAPIGSASAEAQRGAASRRVTPGEDPDARCAPFLTGYRDDYDRAGRGRGRPGVVQYSPS
ncbi:MAG TPA: hypothetical protein VES64_03080, partial [Allosphingosinicella sp.]|nr:hypothetical protein [Allosphingosinicella sp.]